VGDRWQPHDGRPDTLGGRVDDEVLRVDAVAAGHGVVLGAWAVEAGPAEEQRARRTDERLVGAREHVDHCPHRCQVGLGRPRHVAGHHPVVVEGQVDDAIGGLGRGAQVVEVAADDIGTPLGEAGRGRVGAGQTRDRVAVLEEFRGERGADVPGSSGDEHMHEMIPSVMSLTDITMLHLLMSVNDIG
jgi:hypothetical protein